MGTKRPLTFPFVHEERRQHEQQGVHEGRVLRPLCQSLEAVQDVGQELQKEKARKRRTLTP